MLQNVFRPLRFPVNKSFPASLTHAQMLPLAVDSPQLSVSPTSKSFTLQNTPADHEVFRPHETSESNHWNRNFLKSVSSRGQFNKTFTSVIYKCSYLFSDSKTIATLVNYTCKSSIKLAPKKFKAPSTRIRVKKNVRTRRVDGAKTWLWLNWFGRILAVLIYRENKIETGLIKRRFYLYFCFQEWSISHIYNKILFLNSLRSGRLEVVGTRKNGHVCVHYFQASATQATSSKTYSAQPAS